MNEPLPFSLTKLYAQQRAQLIEAYPELADDILALADTLDSISMLPDMLASLLNSALDDEAVAEAITARIQDMQARRSRFEVRADKRRQMVQTLMEHAGMSRLDRPEFTASLSKRAAGVVISDEDAIPDQFVKISRSPDKTAIRDALGRGETVPGALLGNAKQTLTIHTR